MDSDDRFERFLREFLAHGSLVGWLGTVAFALYAVGYVGLLWDAPPLRGEIGFFACLALWGASTGAYRLIFGKRTVS